MANVNMMSVSAVSPPIPSDIHHVNSRKKQKVSFAQSLEQEYEKSPVKLSKHARERMDERHIQISTTEWQLIHSKMDEAKKMGINDSLVLTKDAALVVNMKNQTVITAMGLDEANSRIFTNINGTIVINH